MDTNTIKKAIKLFKRSPESFFGEIIKRMVQSFTYYTGLFQRGYSFTLKNLSLVPTLECNQNCIMCGPLSKYKDKLPSYFKTNLEDLTYFKRIILDTSSYKPDVVLTGGEILLYKNGMKLLHMLSH